MTDTVVLGTVVDTWVLASGAIIIGLLSGVIGASLIRRIAGPHTADRRELADASKAAALFVFLFFSVIGVVVAVGLSDRETLESIPADLLAYSPRILAAGLILIVGRAAALALGGLVARAFERGSATSGVQLANAVRYLVTAAAVVLSISQLGIDATILYIVTAAVVFALALAFALLIGLGGRELGADLATGRYLQRVVSIGDVVRVGDVGGRVVALHSASIEIETGPDSRVHVRYSQVFDAAPEVTRAADLSR
ncbi:MAG: hypothetical protein IH940_02790 [Acidobacteria bacterium]|nr:hypothetical protein [Acidobacteriota bacterium]